MKIMRHVHLLIKHSPTLFVHLWALNVLHLHHPLGLPVVRLATCLVFLALP